MSNYPKKSLRRLAILAGVVALFLTGCGSGSGVPIAAVRGKVTRNNQPITEGLVCFMSENGFGATAPLQPDGSYQLHSQHGAGIPHGAYKVIVQPPELEFVESEQNAPKAQKSNIPLKYQDFGTSGLELVIGDSALTFDIQLTP
ncbi:hypothetical protein LOC68_13495 [Blastopirellula sp. JC732]|uniref:Carboxypeptidase regulatory-like domain-containing protein n=1 Tax=Blastopirellula sediminis TaxID=2894196 RepID=A0A9X1MLK9_9BACT|nr:hypothetical protein [Blastopirellula sediminis]MCC9607299.1 hypothetical protein [Blastopirellula sediminis]MCC9629408.1 hypothetical protein [Blastopirellula sediminis]